MSIYRARLACVSTSNALALRMSSEQNAMHCTAERSVAECIVLCSATRPKLTIRKGYQLVVKGLSNLLSNS